MNSTGTAASAHLIRQGLSRVAARGGGDLTRVSEAALTARHAASLRDQVVAEARAAGRSWGAIAAVLGISRQAARQRWGA